MIARPCLDCGRIAQSTRCQFCESKRQAERNASRPQYRGDWSKLAREAIGAYRDEYGDLCPGYRREPHVIDVGEWTCDHDIGPLCRSCNGRKGGGDDKR